ncbi:MAG: Uncharacterized protein FD149_1579 [Rhodospirillaceae bacterium]|nr:MAG: Uncharacterized protein FD149_1579 [Rhodospirillaceae bacterium]
MIRQNDGLRLGAEAFAAAGGNPVVVDAALAAAVAESLVAMVRKGRKGRKGTLVLPLHYATVRHHAATGIAAALAVCPEAIRHLHLMLDVHDLPNDVSADAVATALASIHSWARAVFVRCHRLMPVCRELEATVGGISIDLAATPERQDTTLLTEHLSRLRAVAPEGTLCVWNAQRRSDVLAAVQAGCTMVNGPALLTDLLEPRKATPVPMESFRRFIPERS